MEAVADVICAYKAIEAFRGQRTTGSCVFEATEFDSEVICDLRGRLEAENGHKPNRIILPQNFITKIAPCSLVQRLGCWTLNQGV